MKFKFGLTFVLAISLFSMSCLPSAPGGAGSGKGERRITVYGFSIMKESLEKEIYPAFAAKWKAEHGEDVRFESSFAGSETVTNQILQGAPADIGIFSIERDVGRLIAARHVPRIGTSRRRKASSIKRRSSSSSAKAIRKASRILPIWARKASRSFIPSARAARNGRFSRFTARS